jgi:hypothetical protein
MCRWVGTVRTGPLDRIEAESGSIISHNYLYEAASIVLYDEEAHTAYGRFRPLLIDRIGEALEPIIDYSYPKALIR